MLTMKLRKKTNWPYLGYYGTISVSKLLNKEAG
jgi:hypothetical protein